VALLAKRGGCTYETKARVAASRTRPREAVRFVIVYDDRAEDKGRLIEMMPRGGGGDHDLHKEVGLVFVSYESGVELRELLSTQPDQTRQLGGPRILIDGSDSWLFPPMDQSAAGLAFMLILLGCFCSMSLFVNTRLASGTSSLAAGVDRTFMLGPGGRAREGTGGGRGARAERLRLLTLEEVETLPTREYSAPTTPQGLEMHDKSMRPHLTDEEGDDGDGDAAAQRHADLDDEDAARAGGLCETLLPSLRKPDPYLDQNTCSICLDEYEPGEEIRVLPCNHTFHSQCIFPWLTERSPTCPLCKAMFEAVQYDDEEEEEADGGPNEAVDAQGDVERPTARASATAQEGTVAPPEDQDPPEDVRVASRPRGSLRGRLRDLFGRAPEESAALSAALEETLLADDGSVEHENVV